MWISNEWGHRFDSGDLAIKLWYDFQDSHFKVDCLFLGWTRRPVLCAPGKQDDLPTIWRARKAALEMAKRALVDMLIPFVGN